MFIVQLIAVLCIVSDTVARIGFNKVEKVAKVLGEDLVKRKPIEIEEETCRSYDRVIAPKIAQNMNGK